MEKVEEVRGGGNTQGCERNTGVGVGGGRFGVMAGIREEMEKFSGINIITKNRPFDYFLSTGPRMGDLIVFGTATYDYRAEVAICIALHFIVRILRVDELTRCWLAGYGME